MILAMSFAFAQVLLCRCFSADMVATRMVVVASPTTITSRSS